MALKGQKKQLSSWQRDDSGNRRAKGRATFCRESGLQEDSWGTFQCSQDLKPHGHPRAWERCSYPQPAPSDSHQLFEKRARQERSLALSQSKSSRQTQNTGEACSMKECQPGGGKRGNLPAVAATLWAQLSHPLHKGALTSEMTKAGLPEQCPLGLRVETLTQISMCWWQGIQRKPPTKQRCGWGEKQGPEWTLSSEHLRTFEGCRTLLQRWVCALLPITSSLPCRCLSSKPDSDTESLMLSTGPHSHHGAKSLTPHPAWLVGTSPRGGEPWHSQQTGFLGHERASTVLKQRVPNPVNSRV